MLEEMQKTDSDFVKNFFSFLFDLHKKSFLVSLCQKKSNNIINERLNNSFSQKNKKFCGIPNEIVLNHFTFKKFIL